MKFRITETIHSEKVKTVRLGTSNEEAGRYSDADVGKPVKLVGESRYALCAEGDMIEGYINSVNPGTQDGYTIGGIISTGYKEVTFGASVEVGDYVVAGAPVAAGTALTAPLAVVPGGGGGEGETAAAQNPFKARVVSLGDVGTGAEGTVGIVELF